METSETKPEEKTEKPAQNDGKTEEECPYKLPIRCDISVNVTEIEWTEEVTDEKLETSTDLQTDTFPLPPLQISQSYVTIVKYQFSSSDISSATKNSKVPICFGVKCSISKSATDNQN